MTQHPILDSADQAPELPVPGSVNGTRPKSSLLAAHEPVQVGLGTTEPPAVDLQAAEKAAADFLAALGIDLDREERQATPGRMARAYAELLAPQPFQLTTFPNHDGYDELVLARAIPFRTICEHHMLLFSGIAHVGYLPGERILGLSKLARLVAHFAAQPQTQERMTMQVANCLEANLHPRGVGVVLEAEHTCMTQRGIRALGATTVTSALLGTLRTDPRSRAEFLALTSVPSPVTGVPH
jgi:GTP cyclohydrolase I